MVKLVVNHNLSVNKNDRKGEKNMSRRGDNIHKRKDGRWEGRYKKASEYSENFKYISVYGKSYKEVKEKLQLAQQNSEHKIKNNIEKTFEEVLYLWLSCNRVKYKGATETKYTYLIERHIAPELGKKRIGQITTEVLNKFIENKLTNGRIDCQGGLSNAYVRNIALIVNAAMKFAVDEQLCSPKNVSVHKPIINKGQVTVFSLSEQRIMEKHLLQGTDRTKLGILLSLYMGLRIGEVCALTWEQVDFNECVIHIRSTISRVKCQKNMSKKTELIIDSPKTLSSIRDIPIPSKLLPIMLELKKTSTSNYVISDKPMFVSPRTYEYRYHNFLESCKVKQVNYHILRHTFATRCIEAGVDVKTLSEVLGHSNVSITLNTYVHSSLELKRLQIEKATTF